MARLARVYIRVNDYRVDEQVLTKLANIAEDIATNAGQEFFNAPVDIDLTLEEGSLKVWAVVSGLLLGSYHCAAEYKDFRESLVLISKDARAFTDAFSERFLQSAGIPKSKVSSKRIDLQTPGRLLKAFEELERLNEEKTGMRRRSASLVDDQLSIATEKLTKAMSDLNPDERTLVSEISPFKSLPPPLHWPSPTGTAQSTIKHSSHPNGLTKSVMPVPGPTSHERRTPKLKVKRKVRVQPKTPLRP